MIFVTDSTIAAQLEAPCLESISSRSSSTKELTSDYKIAHILSLVIESGDWRLWNETQQKEFWNCIKVRNLPIPIARPRDLGKDSRGRDLSQFSPTEFYNYIRKERQVGILRTESRCFREQPIKKEADIETERNRRKLLNMLKGNKTFKYEDDPNWDDVIPIPQEDSEKALAAITYTDEYSEGRAFKIFYI